MEPEDMLKLGIELGAEEIEVFFSSSTYRLLRVEKKSIYPLDTRIKGASFRVAKNRNIGFSFTTDLSKEAVEYSIKTAINNALSMGPDENYAGLPEESRISSVYESKLAKDIDFQELMELYSDIRARILEEKKVYLGGGGGIIIDAYYRILNSNGVDSLIKFQTLGLIFLTLTKEYPPAMIMLPIILRDKIDVDKITEKVIEKTLEFYGAKEIHYSGKPEIVFSPYALALMSMLLDQQITASAIDAGRSPYKLNDLGEKVASEKISIIDNPRSKQSPYPTEVDMEGVPARKKYIIRNGILENILTDHYYSKKLGLKKTGNLVRTSFWTFEDPVFSSPLIMPWFLEFEGEEAKFEELVSDIREGFIILDMMGVHQSDVASGKFSVPAIALYVKNGEIKHPVRNVMISGYLPEVLRNVELISKEKEDLVTGAYPYIKTKGVKVSAIKSPLLYRVANRLISSLIKIGIIKF